MTGPVKHTAGYVDFLRANDMPIPERLVNDAAAEIARLRAALRIIAGEEQCRDNLLGNSDIARIALHGK